MSCNIMIKACLEMGNTKKLFDEMTAFYIFYSFFRNV